MFFPVFPRRTSWELRKPSGFVVSTLQTWNFRNLPRCVPWRTLEKHIRLPSQLKIIGVNYPKDHQQAEHYKRGGLSQCAPWKTLQKQVFFKASFHENHWGCLGFIREPNTTKRGVFRSPPRCSPWKTLGKIHHQSLAHKIVWLPYGSSESSTLRKVGFYASLKMCILETLQEQKSRNQLSQKLYVRHTWGFIRKPNTAQSEVFHYPRDVHVGKLSENKHFCRNQFSRKASGIP